MAFVFKVSYVHTQVGHLCLVLPIALVLGTNG